MKAKQLILELKELVKEYGNQEVTISREWGDSEAMLVAPYDKEGNGPQDPQFNGVKRFHIH